MNTGWLLMGACLIFGGEDSPNKNAHGMEQVKALQEEFEVSSGEKSWNPLRPQPLSSREAVDPGLERIYFSFMQAPQLKSWSPWGLRRHFPLLTPLLTGLRENSKIVRECLNWPTGLWEARSASPVFDLVWRDLQGYSGSKLLRAVEVLGFFQMSFYSGWGISFSLEADRRDGKFQPRCEKCGSLSGGNETSFSIVCGTGAEGEERLEYRGIKRFLPQMVGDARTRTFVRTFHDYGKVNELQCFEGKVDFEILAEDWQQLTWRCGKKEKVLWSSGTPRQVHHGATLTLLHTQGRLVLRQAQRRGSGDWFRLAKSDEQR